MSLLRRLFGSAMMSEALRERREILLESFDILRKETTMGTEKTYKLKGPLAKDEYQGIHEYVVEVPAAELRRVLREEGAAINAGTISTFFGMTIESILELRRQYDLRGGSPNVSAETVRRAFEGALQPLFKGSVIISGGRDGAHYAVDLDKGTVSSAAGFRPITYGSFNRRHMRRRQGAEDRRTSIIRPLTEWEHECKSDYRHRTTLRSPFCPECGISRLQGVERRALAHRRSPFDSGRRKEDA